MGDERFERYLQSFDEPAPVSIRLNPKKRLEVRGKRLEVCDGEPVPWCRDGYYLKQRPNFTMDPLLHAGCYYVQEAASMFLDEVLRQITQKEPSLLCNSALDMCAAPGGKSTLLRAALPDDCVLYSNEPIRNRASILLENVTKWGYPNHIVTNAYPKDYRASKLRFDVILCDVPCSGEGMFRKDPATIGEWSPGQVEKCWKLQREIISDAWACLREGGILIYSTCTFNTKENEENIRWILETYDAEALEIPTDPSWNITGSLLQGFEAPVYRFIPGITRSEGLFVCALRKKGTHASAPRKNLSLKVLKPDLPEGEFPQTDLTYPEALKYLRGEALVLPADTPRGIVNVTYRGIALGPVKNIGNRANNLYPKAWRIKTTHLPTEAPEVLV